MSVMTILRRAFGFSPETEEEEGEYDPTVPTDAVNNDTETPTESPTAPTTPSEEPESETSDSEAGDMPIEEDTSDPRLTNDLFDAVIDLFNRTQPEFVRECLNVEAQRQYILNSLSESLRQRVDSALSADSKMWEKEREELLKKIAELEGDENELTSIRDENRKLRLSADRQKHALLDRINDLEAQLTKQVQEKERFFSRKPSHDAEELAKATARVKGLEDESESLKAKNSELEIRGNELETRRNELEAKIKELEAEKADLILKSETQMATSTDIRPENDEKMSASEALISELKSKNSGLEAKVAELGTKIPLLETQNSALEQDNEAMAAECERLRGEVVRQLTLKEQLEVKCSMSDVMINDLRNQVAAMRKELERQQNGQEDVVGQIQEQLDRFEEIKARKDAKINELQESNASLHRTIETNLYNQANSEMKLRSEIKKLKAELARRDATPEEPRTYATGPVKLPAPSPESAKPAPAKRRGRPKKVRIDNNLDNTDWFSGKQQRNEDPDFGYHEPPRKPVNDNEAQLTLF